MIDFVSVLCTAAVSVIILSYFALMFLVWRRFIQFQRVRHMDMEICYTCCDSPANVAFVPCGHGGLCHACAGRILGSSRRCPLCRGEIKGVLFVSPA